MTFIQELLQHRMRVIKSIAVYLAFSGCGVCSGIVGPTLLDLQIAANSTPSEIAMVLPGRSGGYALGSFTVGLLYTFCNPQLLILLCLLMSTCLIAIVPWMRSLWAIIGVLFSANVFNGMIDSGGNMFVLHIWGKENAPFMQALHFSWGIGAFIAPLVAKPFLLPLESQNTAIDNSSSTNGFTNSTTKQVYTQEDLLIQWPYAFGSVYMVCGAVLFFYLYTFQRTTPPHPTREAALAAKKASNSNTSSRNRMKVICVLLTALFLHLHCGVVIAYGTLLTPYAVNCSLNLSKATGALMSALFWGFFTFFRLFTIFYIGWTGPEKNIIYELATTVVGCALLVPFGNSSVSVLWVGVALMGLGCSSIWASTYGFLEQFFPLTSKMTATFTVSACLGEFVIPTIMGNYLEDNPDIFLWTTLVCTVADCVIFALLSYLLHKNFDNQPTKRQLDIKAETSHNCIDVVIKNSEDFNCNKFL